MQKSVIKPVERLENMLQVWEQMLLIVQATLTHGAAQGSAPARENLVGAVGYWPTLRKKLLSREPLSYGEFGITDYVTDNYFMKSPIFNLFPFALEYWSKSSRRIYNPSEDFQMELESTSLGNIKLSDIVPPFQSFGMSLPIPIPWKYEEMEGEFDFVLVEFQEKGVRFIGLGPEPYVRMNIPPKKRFRLQRAIRDLDLPFLEMFVKGLHPDHYHLPSTHMVTLPLRDEPIMKTLGNDDFSSKFISDIATHKVDNTEMPDFWQLIARMAFGLCLHLEMMSRKNRKQAQEIIQMPWKANEPTARMVHERYITDEALVCGVQLSSPLSLEAREAHAQMRAHGLRRSGYVLGSRFCGGYWRRWPGTADNLAAPKYKVKGYQTHRDLLPKVGLPVGAAVPIG